MKPEKETTLAGTNLGGIVIESGQFNWGNGKFPQMTEPVPSYGGVRWWENFGEYGFLTKLRSEQLRDIGPALSPLAAFQLLQGIETLPLRLDAQLAKPGLSRNGWTPTTSSRT